MEVSGEEEGRSLLSRHQLLNASCVPGTCWDEGGTGWQEICGKLGSGAGSLFTSCVTSDLEQIS